MSLTIPLPLRNALELGECVLFVGAGAGAHLKGNDGKALPSGAGFAAELADKIGIKGSAELGKVSALFELRKGRPVLDAEISGRFSVAEPDEHMRALFSQRWRAIFTTNYDNGIERAFQLQKNPRQNPVVISATSDLRQWDPRFEVPIFHLHGRVGEEKKSRYVITPSDYIQFREKRRMVFELLKLQLATSTVLYLGYSNRDSNWITLFEEIEEDFLPATLPPSFRVTPDIDPLDDELFRAASRLLWKNGKRNLWLRKETNAS